MSSQSKQQFKLPASNDIQILEKSLENLVKINKYDNENRPVSDHKDMNLEVNNEIFYLCYHAHILTDN